MTAPDPLSAAVEAFSAGYIAAQAQHPNASGMDFHRSALSAAIAAHNQASGLLPFACHATALLHAMAGLGLGIDCFCTEDMWEQGMTAIGESMDYARDDELAAKLLARAAPAVEAG